MYGASCLEARELGAAQPELCLGQPAVSSSQADILYCLHTVATVLVLLAVISPGHPALPSEPQGQGQGQVCFRLL